MVPPAPFSFLELKQMHIFSSVRWFQILVLFRDRPFNLKGGLWFIVSFRNFFSDNTRVRIFIFLSRKAQIFFSECNVRLYNKNSEEDYIFFLHQNQNIFFSSIGNQNIFLEKNHNPPPLKLNGRSLMMCFFTCFWVNLWTAHFYQLGALLLRKGVKCHSPIL